MNDTQRSVLMVENALEAIKKVDDVFQRKESVIRMKMEALQDDLKELTDQYKYADSLIFGLELFKELYPHAEGGMYPTINLNELREFQNVRLKRMQVVLNTKIPGIDESLIRQRL
ncbi:hypothetical protein CSV61_16070 [Sporosarcina sp. P3]|uniref:hypothetical protein n=1 Tax=Sporosarcina sp. P3 TaxID=2048245 RepID=UPI000C16316D|nr:hypothetical protein [Sporosarcina sp. P3]PID20164.1 hypothetical protein CSV61_16070 [Sporosarcina sp. P3]